MQIHQIVSERTALYDVLIQEIPGERTLPSPRRQPRAWPLSAPSVACLEAVNWELAEAFADAFNYAERKHPTGRWASVHLHAQPCETT